MITAFTFLDFFLVLLVTTHHVCSTEKYKMQIIQISTNCKYKNCAKDNYIFLLKRSKRVTLPLKSVCNQNQLSFSLASNCETRLTKKFTKRNLVVANNSFCWKIPTWVKCTQFELFINRWSRKKLVLLVDLGEIRNTTLKMYKCFAFKKKCHAFKKLVDWEIF